jgi:hypothetical protein
MNKVSNYNKVNAILVIAIIVNTIVLVVINNILYNKLEDYKAYYNASEALFEEIEEYNENLFDTDKAIDYYKSKEELPISNE